MEVSLKPKKKKKMRDGVKNIQLRRDFHSFPIFGGKEKEGTFSMETPILMTTEKRFLPTSCCHWNRNRVEMLL